MNWLQKFRIRRLINKRLKEMYQEGIIEKGWKISYKEDMGFEISFIPVDKAKFVNLENDILSEE